MVIVKGDDLTFCLLVNTSLFYSQLWRLCLSSLLLKNINYNLSSFIISLSLSQNYPVFDYVGLLLLIPPTSHSLEAV